MPLPLQKVYVVTFGKENRTGSARRCLAFGKVGTNLAMASAWESDTIHFSGSRFSVRESETAGDVRWYALHVRKGKEAACARMLRQIVPAVILSDCFFPTYEKFLKRNGVWTVVREPLFDEYVFAGTKDVRSLVKCVRSLSFPVEVVGSQAEQDPAPLQPDAQAWLEETLDSGHVLRASTGVVEDGVLRVVAGPLMGRESSIRRIDRHKRLAYVGFAGEGTNSVPLLRAGLEVPTKS